MYVYHLNFVIVVLIGTAGILADEKSSTEPAIKNAEVIKSYFEVDNTSFTYRYYFDDGSIVSQAGKFEVVSITSDTPINTPDNKYNTLHGFGKGYIRFIIRRKIYEFNYDIAEDTATGILTYVSSNGTILEEVFNQTTSKGYWYYAGFYNPAFRHEMVPFNEYSLTPKYVHFAIRFPPNANHVSFGCEFGSSFNNSQFLCMTFVNTNVTPVDFTSNEADMD